MKKIILFLIAISFIVACSSDDDEPTTPIIPTPDIFPESEWEYVSSENQKFNLVFFRSGIEKLITFTHPAYNIQTQTHFTGTVSGTYTYNKPTLTMHFTQQSICEQATFIFQQCEVEVTVNGSILTVTNLDGDVIKFKLVDLE